MPAVDVLSQHRRRNPVSKSNPSPVFLSQFGHRARQEKRVSSLRALQIAQLSSPLPSSESDISRSSSGSSTSTLSSGSNHSASSIPFYDHDRCRNPLREIQPESPNPPVLASLRQVAPGPTKRLRNRTRLGDFTYDQQQFLAVMRCHWYKTIISRNAWPSVEEASVYLSEGIAHAHSITGQSITTIFPGRGDLQDARAYVRVCLDNGHEALPDPGPRLL